MSMTREEALTAFLRDRNSVQYCFHDGTWGNPIWELLDPDFFWEASRWRLKPEPKRVPLEPEDVPPGSVVRGGSFFVIWAWVTRVDDERIHVGAGERGITYEDLMDSEISTDFGKTWRPCSKEVVS